MFKTAFFTCLIACGMVYGEEVALESDAKIQDAKELIRSAIFQQDQTNVYLSAIVQQTLSLAKSEMSAEQIAEKAKERFSSDEFLKKFTSPFDKNFTRDEIKMLIGFYKTDAMRKFYITSAETLLPIYTAMREVVSDIVKISSGAKEPVSDRITTITAKNFQQEVKESKGSVLLEVYSTFCAPCQAMAPTFSELSNELGDKVKFMKLNLDGESNLSKELEVHSVPTLLFIKDGKIIDRHLGMIQKEDLSKTIKEKLY